ncbi:uncharacterized protein LOC118762811 [Octopus sinensis]|uniref:Uncharacterized protein LOC118762811 n=1 Tax=Octopus sinensis TaxID=2607531 RepID=A0A7E6EQH8_9MOLL|nr:uncharacterized protein LOC118762811 [Octopus sinensis]
MLSSGGTRRKQLYKTRGPLTDILAINGLFPEENRREVEQDIANQKYVYWRLKEIKEELMDPKFHRILKRFSTLFRTPENIIFRWFFFCKFTRRSQMDRITKLARLNKNEKLTDGFVSIYEHRSITKYNKNELMEKIAGTERNYGGKDSCLFEKLKRDLKLIHSDEIQVIKDELITELIDLKPALAVELRAIRPLDASKFRTKISIPKLAAEDEDIFTQPYTFGFFWNKSRFHKPLPFHIRKLEPLDIESLP